MPILALVVALPLYSLSLKFLAPPLLLVNIDDEKIFNDFKDH